MNRQAPSPSRSSRSSALHCAGCLILVAAASLTGCATNGETSVLRDLPPAQYTLLVDWPDGDGAKVAVRFGGEERTVAAAEFGEMLAQELRLLNASSRVVTRNDRGDTRADLTVILTPSSAIELSHVGTTNFVAAGGLWLITWFGGLLVDDSTYQINMQANCRFAIDADVGVDRTVTGAEASLSFFERNDLVSWPGLQSLILPPFWTTDQQDTTCAALERESVRIAAQQIARELKADFEESTRADLHCSVKLLQPVQNGLPVSGTSMPIKLQVDARDKVSRVTASVNGQKPVVLDLQPVKTKFEATGMLSGFDPGADNWVRVVVTSDDNYTRTLRFGAKQ